MLKGVKRYHLFYKTNTNVRLINDNKHWTLVSLYDDSFKAYFNNKKVDFKTRKEALYNLELYAHSQNQKIKLNNQGRTTYFYKGLYFMKIQDKWYVDSSSDLVEYYSREFNIKNIYFDKYKILDKTKPSYKTHIELINHIKQLLNETKL